MKIKPSYLKQYLSMLDKYVSSSITDTQGVILYASEAFSEMTGYTKDELIGKTHSILRHPQVPESTYKELWQTITQGEPWRGRLKNMTKNRDAYWVDAHIEPIFKKKTIVGYHAIRKNITDEALYKKLAHTDSLTALYNRTSIEYFASRFIDDAENKNFEFSIIMIDLDDFKSVNDTFGHQAGDIVLKKVAEIARALIRLTDRMGRWGGEEFIILLPNTSNEQAKELAERLRVGISIYHFDGVGSATASFGVSSFEREDSFYSLIQRADEALYRAKESGKNQVC